MLKPLTLSLSLALALGFSSMAMAHGFDAGCTTCGLASPQGGPIASPQGYAPTVASCDECAPAKKCNLFGHLGGKLDKAHCKIKGLLHPPVTYEWVLKKKRMWGHKNDCGGCDQGGCDQGCGPVGPVYPTSQVVPSGQVSPAPQAYAAPQAAPKAAPQAYGAPQAAPVYGAGQHTFMSRPASTVALTGEEAPPAPEIKTGGLLLPTTDSE
jgi:hypothetical protein